MARLRAGLGLVAAALAFAPASERAQSVAEAVKATYLYKLAPFVDWPSKAAPAAGQPMVICVQAPESFSGLVARAAGGQYVAQHPIVVRRITRLDPESGCHIAYLTGGPDQTVAQALASARGAPVLTVTDDHGGDHGIVDFVLKGGRVRFAVDLKQAQQARLDVSSKLLALAVGVSR